MSGSLGLATHVHYFIEKYRVTGCIQGKVCYMTECGV